jgi:hypothetical protein
MERDGEALKVEDAVARVAAEQVAPEKARGAAVVVTRHIVCKVCCARHVARCAAPRAALLLFVLFSLLLLLLLLLRRRQ